MEDEDPANIFLSVPVLGLTPSDAAQLLSLEQLYGQTFGTMQPI